MNLRRAVGRLGLLLLLVLIASFTLFYKLGYENVNVDQLLWYTRTQKFFTAISQAKFQDTYQQYHPGVLLMYLIGFGQGAYKLLTGDANDYPNIAYANFGIYNFYTKFFVVSFSLLAILLSAYMLKKLVYSSKFAYLFLVLVFFESYYVGVVRNLHLDGLVSVLIFSTTLSFYLGYKLQSMKYVLISGVLMGLGMLTKSTSIFAGVFCLMAFVGYAVTDKSRIKWYIKAGLLWATILVVIFCALFPAMWVDPVSTVNKIVVEGVFETGANGGFTHYVDNIRKRDPGPLFYLLVLKYRVSPVTQLGLFTCFVYMIYRIITSIKTRRFVSIDKSPPSIYALSLLYVTLYLVTLTIASKKTDRYISPIFPFILMDAGYMLLLVYKAAVKRVTTKIANQTLIALVFLYSLANTATLSPYYIAYYNHVWGGITKAKKEIYLNQSGIGYFELANYLNSLNLPAGTLIGATSTAGMKVLVKYNIHSLQPNRRKEYKLVIIPLQQDALFKSGRKVAYQFKIQNQEYWDVYYRDIVPKVIAK